MPALIPLMGLGMGGIIGPSGCVCVTGCRQYLTGLLLTFFFCLFALQCVSNNTTIVFEQNIIIVVIVIINAYYDSAVESKTSRTLVE